MSEGGEGPIDIPVTSSGAEGIDRIVSAIDRLYAGLESLGSVSGLTRLEQQMQLMQASMTTGFAELAALAQKGGNETVAAFESTSNKVLSIEQRRDVELNSLRQKAMTDYVGWWDRMLSIQESRDTQMNALAQKAATEYVSWWEKAAAEREALEQRRDVEINALRQKELLDYVSWWDKTLAADEAALARQLELERRQQYELAGIRGRAQLDAEAAAERQRVLNTGYLTASPASQVHTAQQAQVYGQLGGDAATRYGSAAAGADALAMAEARLALSARAAGAPQAELNEVMRQAEGAFRGAAHQAGVYGMHHGQLIALLAGGALAAALHHIALTGAEVEYSLSTFPALASAMNREPIDMDKFVGITSGTLENMKEAAEGMRALAEAGLTQQQAFVALPDVLRLAALGDMSVAQAAEMAVESMHAFGKSVYDIGAIGDTLVAVASMSNVSVHKLAEDMKSAAVTGEMFGLSMQETAATVGVLAERGLTIQPLSSALMKLYEPSAKVAAEMKALGLSTKDGEGHLKNYTQFMGELADTVNQFKVPADMLKLLGMSSRDSKALEVMTQDFEGYQHILKKTGESSGMMFEATIQKANTVEGAFKQLGSTVEGSLVKAFEQASPTIRAVENDLMKLAGDGGTISALGNLVAGTARLTQGLVENAGAITLVVGAYAGMRMLTGLIALAAEYTAAKAAETAVQEANALATANSGRQLSLLAVEETAAAAGGDALAVSLAADAAAMRLATSALGVIGVALAIAGAAYELFAGKMDEHEAKRQTQINTHNTTIQAYDQEIARLEQMNAQLEKVGNTGAEAAQKVALFSLYDQRTQAQQALGQAWNKAPGIGYSAANRARDLAQADAEVKRIDKAIAEQERRVINLHDTQEKSSFLVDRRTIQGTIEKLDKELAPVRKVNPSAVPDLEAQIAKAKALVVTESNHVTVLEQVKDLEKAITDAKLNTPVTPDKKTAADAYRARVTGLDEELQQAQKAAQTAQRDLESAYKTGAISAVEAAQKEHDAQVASLNTAIEIAHRKAALAAGKENGQNDIAQASKAESAARASIREADAKLDRDYAAIAAKQSAEATRYEIDQLRQQGESAKAYRLANAVEIAQTDKGLADSRRMLTAAIAAEDAKGVKSAMSMLAGFESAKARYDAAIGTATAVDAVVKAEKEFKNLFTTVKTGIDELAAKSASGGGLSSILGYAFEAQSTYERALPALRASQASLQEKAAASGRPQDLTAANQAMAKLDQEAARMRKTWADVGKSVEKSLTEAFGKSGAAAGHLLNVMIAHANQEQAIRADLAKSEGKDDYEQKRILAIRDLDAAQVTAYADMAGAAKGFFTQHSAGYQLMSGIEKAYHLAEVAMAAKTLVEKTFFKTAEVGVEATTAGAKVGIQTASTAASATLAGTEASAWGITAVVKAIASLPFPLNLAAGAATLAAVVGIGAKMGGGLGSGGDTTAADRQAATGTGSVFGDSKAKSDSIAHAVQLTAANSNIALNYTMSMAASLRNIENSLSGLGNVLIRSGGLTGETAGVQAGVGTKLGSSKITEASIGMALGGPVGAAGVLLLDKLTGGWVSKELGKIGNSIFGGNVHALDTGLTAGRISLGGVISGGLQASQYTDTKTDGGWFSSDKYRTQTSGLGAEANQQLTQAVKDMAKGVTEDAKLLGVGGDAFNARLNQFVVDIGKISTKGLTGDQIQKQLEAAFSKVGDDMAKFAVGGLEKYAKVGEGYFETLTRVATDYANVGAIFDSLGKSLTVVSASTTAFGDHIGGFFGKMVNGFVDYMKQSLPTVSTLSVEARERLVELAGGIDKMASQASGFAQNFLTKAEQLAPVSKYVNDQLAALGYTSIKTRDDFKNLILGLDVSTQKGAEQYTALMALQDAFAKTHAATVDLTKTEQEIADERTSLLDQLNQLTKTEAQLTQIERAKLDASNRALFDQVQAAKAVKAAKDTLASAYDTERQSIQSTIDRLKTLASGWKQFRDGLMLGDKSPLTPGQKYEEARNQYLSTLTAARSGDTAAQGQYQTAAAAFLDASRAANASSQQYTNDYNSVLKATDEATSWAQQQVDVAQQSLTALDASVSALIDIKQGVISVQQAIDNLARATLLYQVSIPSAGAPSGGTSSGGAPFTPTPAGQILPGGVNDIGAILRGTSQYNTPAYVADPLAGSGARQVQQAPADAPTKAQMDALLKEISSLKEQMAKSSQDGTDANVDATMAAAGIVADRFDRAAEAVAWKERVRPVNK